MIDVAALRQETPACETRLHFNNAGASFMASPVFAALTDHLALEQRVGGYEAQADAAADIADFYAAFAEMLGAHPDEIAFMESATKAWDSAFYALSLRPGDRVIVHRSTYSSNYLALMQQAKRRGLKIDFAPSDELGQIDVAALSGLMTSQTKLILLTHCPSQSGLIQPAAKVGAFAEDHGLIYLLDACQSAGQMPLNVSEIGCHILTGTGRKFLRGPRGTGFLYMQRALADTLEPPMVDLQSADWIAPDRYELAPGARRFEAWERNVAGQIALGRAVRYAMDVGLNAVARRVQSIAASLRDQLSGIDGVTVHDPGAKRSAIVTLSKSGVDVAQAKAALRAQGINVSIVPRHWALLDAEDRGLPDLIRASVHAYNTEAEVTRFVKAIAAL